MMRRYRDNGHIASLCFIYIPYIVFLPAKYNVTYESIQRYAGYTAIVLI